MEDLENEVKEENEKIPLAVEILRELKEQNRRLMRVVYALLVTVVLIVGGFLVYMYQYDYSSYSQDGSGYNNINTGEQGDVNNGTEIPSEKTQGQEG